MLFLTYLPFPPPLGDPELLSIAPRDGAFIVVFKKNLTFVQCDLRCAFTLIGYCTRCIL